MGKKTCLRHVWLNSSLIKRIKCCFFNWLTIRSIILTLISIFDGSGNLLGQESLWRWDWPAASVSVFCGWSYGCGFLDTFLAFETSFLLFLALNKLYLFTQKETYDALEIFLAIIQRFGKWVFTFSDFLIALLHLCQYSNLKIFNIDSWNRIR